MHDGSLDSLLNEAPPSGSPEWLLTFGDLMSLLLTFFVLLVSMSELKSENRVLEAVDSMNKQFGRDHDPNAPTTDGKPGTPRTGRPHIRALGAERMPVFGDSIVFGEDSIVVTDEEKLALRRLGEQIQGKLQKIEIRGHTTRRPLPAGSPYADHWELAYARAREVMRLLVEQGIDPRRLRISVSGGNEPAYQGDDAREIRANSRVDLFLLNEFSGDDEKSSPPPSAAQSVR